MWQESYNNEPTLYLIPTPIGNLDDITFRAVKLLEEAEVIFSEDTRVTAILLNHYKIKKKLIPLHEHNEDKQKDRVLEYLKNGKSIALVTDRGTPIISDPGYKTVQYIIENKYNVVALPGPCAFVPALISSGISPQPFMFYGFLNSKDTKIKKELENLVNFENTIIFYEAPHRLTKTINLLLEIFGNRQISISREISKKFESIFRGTLSDAINNINNIKGEIVIVIEGDRDTEINPQTNIIDDINLYIKSGLDSMEAIKRVSKERKIAKNEVYKEYHRR